MGVSRRQTFHGKLSFASAAVKDTRKYQEVWDCLTGDFNTAQMLTSYSLSARPCMFIHLHEDTVTAESEASGGGHLEGALSTQGHPPLGLAPPRPLTSYHGEKMKWVGFPLFFLPPPPGNHQFVLCILEFVFFLCSFVS